MHTQIHGDANRWCSVLRSSPGDTGTCRPCRFRVWCREGCTLAGRSPLLSSRPRSGKLRPYTLRESRSQLSTPLKTGRKNPSQDPSLTTFFFSFKWRFFYTCWNSGCQRMVERAARQAQCMFPSRSLTVVPSKRYLTDKGSSTQIVSRCPKFSSSAIPTYRYFSISDSFWTTILKVNTLQTIMKLRSVMFHMGIWDYSSTNFYSISWTNSLSFCPLANTE